MGTPQERAMGTLWGHRDHADTLGQGHGDALGTTEPERPLGTGLWGQFGGHTATGTPQDRAMGTLWGRQSHRDTLGTREP